MMHQSEFHAANVALSRAADKRKSLINIHNNRYTATLTEQLLSLRRKQLLSQVSYDKSPENRIVSISRNMSHTCFRRLATARLCPIHG